MSFDDRLETFFVQGDARLQGIEPTRTRWTRTEVQTGGGGGGRLIRHIATTIAIKTTTKRIVNAVMRASR